MASSLITPLTFNGQSKFSADFQQVLNKAVQAQSIQLAGLQDQQNDSQNRLGTLQSLDQLFSNLQSSVTALASAMGQSALTASLDKPATASVSLTSSAIAGTYQLQVDSLGSATQTIGKTPSQVINDPSTQGISTSGTYTLTVAGKQTSITPASNTLSGLVQAINKDSSLGVTASIVNVGSSGSPDYRLTLQSAKLGAIDVQLNDGTSDLLDTVSTGSLAQYKVNGLSTSITSDSDTITLAPGVSVTLQQVTADGQPATITVAQTTSKAQAALAQFATAYNGAVDGLQTQHGQNAGALSGESVLLVAQQALSSLNGYRAGGTNNGITSLGLSLDNAGHLTFNSADFTSLVGQNFNALSQFMGDSTTGFLKAANDALAGLEDPTKGILKTEQTTIQASLTKLSSKINDQVSRVNLFQETLLAQLAKSDAAIASLQSQVTFFEGLFNYGQNKDN